jgi:predicted Fe-Mo cluster-binding NifX family protein
VLEVVTTREHKVAIATEDGKRIANHFRSAPFFLVYTIKKGRLSSAESRANSRASIPITSESSAECWKVMDEALGDVRVVICSGMGENAYVGLLKRDILPLLTGEEYADRALDMYLRDRLKERPELVNKFTCNDVEDSCFMDKQLERGKKGGEL